MNIKSKIDKSTDEPIIFHESFGNLLDVSRNIIAALTWLKVSTSEAKKFFQPFPCIIELPCSVTEKLVKIDKTILDLVESEGFNKKTPLYSKTLINFYRILTIAVKDIIWKEPNFSQYLNYPELQFLRHIRNASAHNNQFFWGERNNRQIPISVVWRNKNIKEELEGKQLYMDFMKPGDIFILLSDISKFVMGNRL